MGKGNGKVFKGFSKTNLTDKNEGEANYRTDHRVF